MRKPIIVLLIVVVAGSIAFILFRLARYMRPSPTPFGWRARVTTVAGDGAPAFRDTNQPAQAAFADPFGIAIDSAGAIYISDAGDNNRIRKIEPAAEQYSVSTLAGSREGFADGPGTQAAFNTPSGLAVDANGNVFVADTGNNRIRKITREGLVSTVAGDGTAGYADGAAATSRFDGPIGIALDRNSNLYIADTYNDRIRMITPGGVVSTIAGAGRPGYQDGEASSALFDTPCGIVVTADQSLIVADTGNNRLRKISPNGQVTTLPVTFPSEANPAVLRRPLGLAITRDGFLYVTEPDRARVVQVAPDGRASVIGGGLPGFADGVESPRFNQPAGLAIDNLGDIYVADSANYLVRKLERVPESNPAELDQQANRPTGVAPLPRLTLETLGEQSLLWPLDPQQHPHEVVATVGEVRGSFDSEDSRERLHSGLDVFGNYGDVVRTVRSEKVTSPIANWGFGTLNEGMRVGVISYIHLQIGRDKDGKSFNDPRFVQVNGDDGRLVRVRVRRGTRFRPGDALGTVNRMYHVHLNVGPPGGEINPLSLSPVGFTDRIPPVIEKDGIQLFDEAGGRLTEKRNDRLLVKGRVRIVVDAFDRTDMNTERRRLGLYSLGFQVLNSDGSALSGFDQPRINLVFNRLPAERDATKLAYAEESGITVYGSKTTRFLYEVTNIVRDGRAAAGVWDTAELPPGDYILRIIAADYSGNEALEGRDVLITR